MHEFYQVICIYIYSLSIQCSLFIFSSISDSNDLIKSCYALIIYDLFAFLYIMHKIIGNIALRDHFEYGLSLWEMTLHWNVVSHWLSPNPEWSLVLIQHPCIFVATQIELHHPLMCKRYGRILSVMRIIIKCRLSFCHFVILPPLGW